MSLKYVGYNICKFIILLIWNMIAHFNDMVISSQRSPLLYNKSHYDIFTSKLLQKILNDG